MKPSRLVVVAAAIVIAWSVGRVQGQGSGKKVIFSSAEQADYKSMGTTTEVSMAALWGDANKGAHATFTKFVPRYDAGMHTHTNDVWIVGLKGAYLYKDDAGESEWGRETFCASPVATSTGAAGTQKRVH